MHVSYQIIIQVLSTSTHHTSMHIKFKNLCNASKHLNMHISNAIKQVHELAPPICVLLLSKNFLSFSIPQCCSLFVNVHVQLLLLCLNLSLKLSYLCTISPPLSSIFINGVLLIDTNDCIGVDGWYLNLAFLWTPLNVGMTPLVALVIPHVGSFDLDTNRWDISP